MRNTLLIFLLMALASAASAQTAFYKKYAHRSDIRVYCVERYPLSGGDTVTVTFIEADNDSVRDEIRRELMAIDPDRPKKKNTKETEPFQTQSREDIEIVKEKIKNNKHVVSFLSSPLAGDGGQYFVNSPSDRPVILVFHIYSDGQLSNVTRHILSTEFAADK